MIPPARRHRGWRARLCAGALASALAAGLAGSAAAAPAAPAPAAAAPGPLGLAELEFLARQRPDEAEAGLAGLLPMLGNQPSTHAHALAMKGVLQARRDDADGADRSLRALESLLAAAPAARDDVQAAVALVRAEQAMRRGPLRRAARVAADALAQLPAEAAPVLRIRLMRVLANALEDTGKFEDAVRLRQQVITLADAVGPAWRRAEARQNLAVALMQARQFPQARSVNQEAMAMARAAGDLVTESRAWTTHAILLGEDGDMGAELEAMKQAIALTRRAGARGEEVLAMANLADYYLRARDFPTALRLSQEVLPMAREQADTSAESVALANIGLALISMHRRDEGLAYAREAMAIDERTGALANLATTLGELGGYLERAGYLKDALEVYRRHRALSDDVHRRDQQQAVLELQEANEHEQRRRELALLRSENHLKQAQLLNADLQQRVWLAAVAVGVLMLALAGALLLRLRQTGQALSEDNALLRTQSERDVLTGLANRRHLQRLMQPDGAGEPLPFEGSLLLIDLDHFKLVNDAHGHAAGDAVLVEVARRLRATLREEDLVVRWGGEEFLVVAQGLSQDQAQTLAQRLLAAIGGPPVLLPEGALAISASIGFACFPTEPTRLTVNWERALDLVDTALYLAKAHGRNRAYGVRAVHARDERELAQISRGLEEAWSAGLVHLTPLSGPVPAGSGAGR